MRRWRALLSLAGGVLAGGVLAATAVHAAALPSFSQVRAGYRPSDVQVLDRHGQPLQTLRTDPRGRRLAWLALDDVSPMLRQALVLSEDRRFWEHSGVDWAALASSAWTRALNGRTRGASTVTMQLAGLLDEELARPQGGRGLAQKLGQLAAASALEARWRKSEILEAYLNLVPLRGELVGLNAATQTMFAKHASGLDAQEAALLAVLVRAPNADARAVTRRACALLGAMQQPAAGAATLLLPARPCQGLDALAEVALQRRGGMP
ncbi:MAG TPA: biosynthetic peptidoglycan transglycosylase, partial [Ideonella sp.]|nr:biosynthetic peptidoglycan transglycosylase [Ideonella sp.]